jgi:hypothetical protein
MFHWLKVRFLKLLEQAGEKEIQRLLRERERLRTALIKANGGKPIRLTLPGKDGFERFLERVGAESRPAACESGGRHGQA